MRRTVRIPIIARGFRMGSSVVRHLLSLPLIACVLLPSRAGADEVFKLVAADVSVLCPLTIGVDFEAKTTAMTGEVTRATDGVVTGMFAVDLMKLQTGIPLRDLQLRNNYLEVQRGPDFAVAKLVNLKLERVPGTGTIRGLLTLHGQQREVTGVADVQPEGTGYRVAATFPLRISEFQIAEPKYLGVGMADEITVRVKLNAEPARAAVGTSTKK
jgi:polyisoprenoid-binding protein YceI